MNIVNVHPNLIRRSPHNHRKTFTGLDELAASIREKGLINPITVRPIAGIADSFELVAGERRWRAAKIAKLEAIPAIVRELTDKDVLEVQLIENVQRADVHPVEEAEGYEELIEKHGYDVDAIAAKIGKSRAYVYARLKLCSLAPGPRAAFLEGRLNASIALLIARIADVELQADATREVLGEGGWKDYGESGVRAHELTSEDDKGKRITEAIPLSVREAQVHVQRKYMLRLDTAPFDTTDATLVAKAGSCSACPKRTGNQRELFADVRSADVCTDPACFESKKSADWDRKSAVAAKAGVRVLTEKESANKVFRSYGDKTEVDYHSPYVDPKDELPYDLQTPKRKKWKDLLGSATPATVLAKDGAGQARTLWDKQSAIATAKKAGTLKEAKAENRARSSGRDPYREQHAKRQAEAKRRQAIACAAFAKLAASKVVVDAKFWRWLGAAIVEVLDAEDIRSWMKRHELDAAGSGHSHASKVVALVNKALEAELPGMVVELVASFRSVGGLFSGTGYGKNFAATCAHFKVDLAKCKAEVLAAGKAKKKGKK
jgi:ParB/RepB/Spo0J family partition protein